MSAAQASRALRLMVESELQSRFNDQLASDLAEFHALDQAFRINWEPGENYFRAMVDSTQARDYLAKSWPCMQLFTASSTRDDHQQVGVTFEGPVTLRMTVFYRWQAPDQSDMQTLPEAVEGALIQILTDIPGLMQGSLEITCDAPEWLNDCWYLAQQITAEYNITI